MSAHTHGLRISTGRWRQAQKYERKFWQRQGDDIHRGRAGQLDWYDWKAAQLERLVGPGPPGFREGKVLEIGSGPIGIVNSLEWGERYAIDPLEHFYRTKPSLVALRKPGVTYLDGPGEQLPFDDATFALVIIDNVIDHTYRPGAILQEIRRVLREDGCLYLSVNVHTKWGAFLHWWIALLRIDTKHPYTFTSSSLRQFLIDNHFAVRQEQIDDYMQARQADRQSGRLKTRIKGYTGLSEFVHTAVCTRRMPETVAV